MRMSHISICASNTGENVTSHPLPPHHLLEILKKRCYILLCATYATFSMFPTVNVYITKIITGSGKPSAISDAFYKIVCIGHLVQDFIYRVGNVDYIGQLDFDIAWMHQNLLNLVFPMR